MTTPHQGGFMRPERVQEKGYEKVAGRWYDMQRMRIVMGGLLVVFSLATARGFAQMPAMKVVAGEARMMEAPRTISLVATVQPLRQSAIAAEVGGIVQDMPVRQGDFVRAGEVLCRLNTDIRQLRLAAAEARHSALAARHEELVTGTRPAELARLKAMVEENRADLTRWTKELARVERLYEGRDSFAKELYDTQAEHVRAERRLAAAEALYSLAVEGPRREEIARAAHDLAEQEALVQQIRTEIEKQTLRAPFSGYVTELLTEVGQWISDGGATVRMVDLATVLVRVDAPEWVFPHVRVDDPARVFVEALKQHFEGRVRHVVPQADPNARTFPVEIEIANPGALLAAGMFAHGTIRSGAAEMVVAVPKDAVVERSGITYVAMAIPGEQGGMMGMLSAVTLGSEVGGWMAVTSGNIRPGMSVIIRGTERLFPFPVPIELVDERGMPIAPAVTGRGEGAPAAPGRPHGERG